MAEIVRDMKNKYEKIYSGFIDERENGSMKNAKVLELLASGYGEALADVMAHFILGMTKAEAMQEVEKINKKYEKF